MRPLLACLILTLIAAPGLAQQTEPGAISRMSAHVGEMSVTLPEEQRAEQDRERLRFEPWQMLEDLFRDDIVLLMRHGPTDWSTRDARGVSPTDCANQRLMTEKGEQQMQDLGILLAGNGIVPGRILVSEWCRAQQTAEALTDGLVQLAPQFDPSTQVETVSEINLLLSLEGAPTVTWLRETISNWSGGDGPLLIVSHFTNIAELTEFHVYEGEMLLIDPKLGNRVLGYLRLQSAGPDVGHFDAAQN